MARLEKKRREREAVWLAASCREPYVSAFTKAARRDERAITRDSSRNSRIFRATRSARHASDGCYACSFWYDCRLIRERVQTRRFKGVLARGATGTPERD